jgi:hypothetical protein
MRETESYSGAGSSLAGMFRLQGGIQLVYLKNYICEFSVLMYGSDVVGNIDATSFTSVPCIE